MDSLSSFKKRYDFNFSDIPIGKGGFGKVFKAYDKEAKEWVAIKKSEVNESLDKYSLYNEANLAIDLNHPNIIDYREVYRFNTETGLMDFVVMEYANAGDLEDFMLTFPYLEEIKRVILGILEGLQFLHDRKIIHRDLKPSNILLTNENGVLIPKIIDFGISKALSNEVSNISNVIGSMEYMSPEQLGAYQGKIKANSDFWSLGVIVYQMFLGELPFGSRSKGDSRGKITNSILTERLPHDKILLLDEPISSFVKWCFVRDPKKRVNSAKDLIQILKSEKVVPFIKEKPKRSSSGKLRSNKVRGRVVRNFFRFMVIIQLGLIINEVSIFISYNDYGGIDVTQSDINIGGYLLFLLLYLLAGIFFIRWFRRAYYNLHSLGTMKLRYNEWWATGGWFVPVANLFIPFQVMKDIYGKTQEAIPDRQFIYSNAGIGWWWFFFLVGNFLFGGNAPISIDHYYSDEGMMYSALSVIQKTFILIGLFIIIRLLKKVCRFEKELFDHYNS